MIPSGCLPDGNTRKCQGISPAWKSRGSVGEFSPPLTSVRDIEVVFFFLRETAKDLCSQIHMRRTQKHVRVQRCQCEKELAAHLRFAKYSKMSVNSVSVHLHRFGGWKPRKTYVRIERLSRQSGDRPCTWCEPQRSAALRGRTRDGQSPATHRWSSYEPPYSLKQAFLYEVLIYRFIVNMFDRAFVQY